MFGRRPDGRKVVQEDAILALAPYLMPQRVDAQVHSMLRVNCDVLTNYIRAQRDKGHVFSYLDLVIAAYVRMVSQYPEFNRFIHNKRLYARNTISVSLAILKTFENGDEIKESTIKLHFNPTDTIFDVHATLQKAIDENRKPEIANNTDKVARFLLEVPGLPTFIVALVRVLDRYGLMPRFLVNISPFHTGLFITNMMSLGMGAVNHHIYNFGNTSVFVSIGKVDRVPVPGPGGTVKLERSIPLGLVADERVTSGASFVRAFTLWRDLLTDPTVLETPPETVQYDFPPEQMPPVSGRRKRGKVTVGA
ncbi:MAG: hypothetical protein FWF69_04755 [Firmicutes bacterium]|nr:hypothetical protein [Bacillota bacterium]